MGNLGGAEVLVIFIVALLVLGPDKLPEAARQVGKAVNEIRRISAGFQREVRAAIEQPISEVRAEAQETRRLLQATSGARDPAAEPAPGARDPAAEPAPGASDPAAEPAPGARDPAAEPAANETVSDPE